MTDFTKFEALEAFSGFEGSMDLHFQLWLTMTFAAIAASFLARGSLSKPFAHFMASIYLLATAAIAGRWALELFRIRVLMDQHTFLTELFPEWGPFTGVLTLSMFVFGTLGCVFCVYSFRSK